MWSVRYERVGTIEATGGTGRGGGSGVEEIAAHLLGLEGVDLVYLLLETLLEERLVFNGPLFVRRPLLYGAANSIK